MRSFKMSKGIDGEPICEMDTEDGFTEVQFVFRAYLMPFTYLFGIIANTINVIIFSHKKMRNQLVNWFFLILSISDIFVLFSSFFVFSLPVYAEYSGNAESLRISAVLIVYFYPIAQTSLTMSVYLTILVSTHRYLGVCHPFLIRRISNRSVVRGVIIFAIVFAISFNIPRWSELTYMPCSHKDTKKETLVVIPTEFMIGPWYTLIYRNAAYTIVMFFLPFAVLIMLNVRIVNTLRMSNRLRRQMTIQQTACKSSRFPGIKPSETGILEKKKLSIKSGTLIVPERRDHGVTIMLVAMTCEFLLFNLLAFANNMLELTGATSGNSRIETFLVEISSLLVNINGASTIVVYMIFGSKYRAIFLKWIAGSKFTRLAVQAGAPSFFSLGPNETTQLITNASTYDRTRGRRSVPTIRPERSSSIIAAEQRKFSMREEAVTCVPKVHPPPINHHTNSPINTSNARRSVKLSIASSRLGSIPEQECSTIIESDSSNPYSL